MSAKPMILVCDDDPYMLISLQLSLKSAFEVHTANTVSKAKTMVTQSEYEAAIIDLNFEGQELDGIHLLDYVGRKSPGTFLIVLSGDNSVQRAVEAMRRKLFQFIHKHGDFYDDLHSTLNRAIKIRAARFEAIKSVYLTQSPKVKELLVLAERIIQKDQSAAILITGESGSGKEQLVKHISETMRKKVIAANMASIPKETAESTLFGHVKGAFTGAIADRIGLIETANNKFFFLDEIGECSPEVQAKLLRVLQEREIQPMGSSLVRKVSTQFIAATHRDLNKMVEKGEFRLDLLQRLNTFVLKIPSLKERPEDIIFYADLFLNEYKDDQNRYTISADGKERLLAYSWPGNIRELRSVIQRFVVLSNHLTLNAEEVSIAIRMGNDEIRNQFQAETAEVDVKRNKVIHALTESFGNKRRAAASLGISERTFHRWIIDLNINHSLLGVINEKVLTQ